MYILKDVFYLNLDRNIYMMLNPEATSLLMMLDHIGGPELDLKVV